MTTPKRPARPTSEAGDILTNSSPVSSPLVGGSAQAPADRLTFAEHVIAVDDQLAEAIKELAGAAVSAVLCQMVLDLPSEYRDALQGIQGAALRLQGYRDTLKPLVEAALAEIEREASNEQ